MSGGTILVVDDEANIADLVELYLRKEGFRVLKAGSGEDGLATAKRERPRLVVLDVGLPGMDGLEVCRKLQADAPLPVIFLTARDSEIDRVLGLEMGADDYLTKPFSPRELVARVKAVLRRTETAVPTPTVIEAGRAVIDLGRREVRALGVRG
ncbi:MAG: response regulator transcription factor, partial [Acidimicrobiia bacterium]